MRPTNISEITQKNHFPQKPLVVQSGRRASLYFWWSILEQVLKGAIYMPNNSQYMLNYIFHTNIMIKKENLFIARHFL